MNAEASLPMNDQLWREWFELSTKWM